MLQSSRWPANRKAAAVVFGLLLVRGAPSMMAQAPPLEQPSAAFLSPDQLDDLVAPIALYPDQLLAQVLAASTYPLEIVEAQQWIQQNRGLQGPSLLDAARQQNWDPSVQALVAFPDAMTLLTRDVRWTTDLGNAFLAQQADVMNAVQRMRARAQDNGRLASTPQQTVSVAAQDGQSAIEIQPTNPQVMYVPAYNPAYVWGPPPGGAYPPLGYPSVGSGFGFNPGVLIGALFSGLMSFGGWGWGLSWLTHALFLSNLFLGHFGFGGNGGYGGYGGGYGSGFAAHSVWAHNPGHRLGVPYPNRALASRFAGGRSNVAFSNASFSNARSYSSARSAGPREQASGGWHSFEGGSRASTYASGGARSFGERAYQGYRNPSYSAPQRAMQAFASNYRSAPSVRAPAPSARYAAPRSPEPRGSAQHFSSPSHASHFSAPHASSHSGGHSSGHSSGGHPGKHR